MVYYALLDTSSLTSVDVSKLRLKIKKHFIKPDTLKRDDSVAAKALLCVLLKKLYNMSDFIVDCNKNGKPFIAGEKIRFNISHSGKFVLCVVGDEQVGCDIEVVREYKPKVAKRFFTEAEYKLLESSESKSYDFTRLWTLKESVLKFSGEGISGGLDRYCFSEYYNKNSFAFKGLCFNQFNFEDYAVSICSEKGCISQLNADIEDIKNEILNERGTL